MFLDITFMFFTAPYCTHLNMYPVRDKNIESYKNQKMCNKAVDNYPHLLEFVPNCFNTQKMCNKTLNTYLSPIPFVTDQYKTQKMCVKPLDTGPFVFDSVPN